MARKKKTQQFVVMVGDRTVAFEFEPPKAPEEATGTVEVRLDVPVEAGMLTCTRVRVFKSGVSELCLSRSGRRRFRDKWCRVLGGKVYRVAGDGARFAGARTIDPFRRPEPSAPKTANTGAQPGTEARA